MAGWEPARLQPLLPGLLELVPCLMQWHNEIDPAYGERMGMYYGGFVDEEARALGFTLDDLRAWKPAAASARASTINCSAGGVIDGRSPRSAPAATSARD